MALFASETSEFFYMLVAIVAVGKLLLDFIKTKFSHSITGHDKTVEGLEKVMAHADLELERMSVRLTKMESKVKQLVKDNNYFQKCNTYLESELIRNGVKIVRFEDSGHHHRPLESDDPEPKN